MRATIDRAGRLVIPKPIRNQAGIRSSTELEVTVVGDVIELRPVVLPVRLEQRGTLVVAVPQHGLPVMDNEVVERIIAELREGRPAEPER